MKYLEEHGKRLFIQIQDVSFSERANVPNYLIRDPEFSGGVARQHEYKGESEPVFDGLGACPSNEKRAHERVLSCSKTRYLMPKVPSKCRPSNENRITRTGS